MLKQNVMSGIVDRRKHGRVELHSINQQLEAIAAPLLKPRPQQHIGNVLSSMPDLVHVRRMNARFHTPSIVQLEAKRIRMRR